MRWGMRGRGLSSATLQDGPLLAIDSPYVSHGPSSFLTDCYLRLKVRTFRTGRNSVRSIILDYGPLFAVHRPYVEVHISNASMIMPRYYHNLLIRRNKFQLINNSCLSFELCPVIYLMPSFHVSTPGNPPSVDQ